MAKINLKKLIAMHDAGGVLYTKPDSWELFDHDVPRSLLQANADYVKAKENLEREIAEARKLI